MKNRKNPQGVTQKFLLVDEVRERNEIMTGKSCKSKEEKEEEEEGKGGKVVKM